MRVSRALFAALMALVLAAPSGVFAAPGGSPGDDVAVVADAGKALALTITVVHATKGAGGVAPELTEIARYLKKSFPQYSQFTRVEQRVDRLEVGRDGDMKLPNGSHLKVTHSGWKDGYAALHLEVGGLDSTVNVKDGGRFFQAGRGYDGGMIVLAFEVHAAP